MVRIPVQEHWNRLPKVVVFSSVDIPNVPGCVLSPAAGDLAVALVSDNMISRGPFQT